MIKRMLAVNENEKIRLNLLMDNLHDIVRGWSLNQMVAYHHIERVCKNAEEKYLHFRILLMITSNQQVTKILYLLRTVKLIFIRKDAKQDVREVSHHFKTIVARNDP